MAYSPMGYTGPDPVLRSVLGDVEMFTSSMVNTHAPPWQYPRPMFRGPYLTPAQMKSRDTFGTGFSRRERKPDLLTRMVNAIGNKSVEFINSLNLNHVLGAAGALLAFVGIRAILRR